MRLGNDTVELSASDLSSHLSCPHLTALRLAVELGRIERPHSFDRGLAGLQERGLRHEADYVRYLRDQGRHVVRVDDEGGVSEAGAARTLNAMRDGVDVIVQGHLVSGRWRGRPDFLVKVNRPSALGSWSYEVEDAKLARETKGGTILQLCLYSEIVGEMQGACPEEMRVIRPGTGFVPEVYRFAEYAAYTRFVKRRLEAAVADRDGAIPTYPEPCAHCDICDWRAACAGKRREDDHLSLVAGIRRSQRVELIDHGVPTVRSLAAMALPVPFRPVRGSTESLTRVREQARVQVQGRDEMRPVYELLPVLEGQGLCRLPEPSPGDVFFDLEGDPFVGEGGREYLFGRSLVEGVSGSDYRAVWAWTAEDEKRAFEAFVDEMTARWARYPDFHIYHFAPYEPAALKRLMGRYATREEELDRLLRAERFVDLHGVVRQAIRASVERYSIKDLEPFFGYEREADLHEANDQRFALQIELELGNVEGVTEEMRETVARYNRDDCVSTGRLRDWLETLRSRAIAEGEGIPRPEAKKGDPTEKLSEAQQRVRALMERLTAGVPADREERSQEQHARWLVAQMLEWHHREGKAFWWEYYRLRDLAPEDMLDERNCLAGLELVDDRGRSKKSALHTYRFPRQETSIREGTNLRTFEFGDEEPVTLGTVDAIDLKARTLAVKKTKKGESLHPTSVFAHDYIRSDVLKDALFRLGECVAAASEAGGEGDWQAARDLLLNRKPADGSRGLAREGESVLAAAKRLALELDRGILPIQGPPGSGKTYTGARMVAELVSAGRRVGITAPSHKVIQNLLLAVVDAAQEAGREVRCIAKVDEIHEGLPECIRQVTSNEKIAEALNAGEAQVVAGTAWLWAREELAGAVDALFVDEAGQMALANVLAASQAAPSLVLLGDPQQLEQPIQGSHPEGTDVSVLEHILGTQKTISEDRGLFLAETRRLHPEICAFTSALFYDGRLMPLPGLERQVLLGEGRFAGAGLRFEGVAHRGNVNSSPEEVDAIARIVKELTMGCRWRNAEGEEQPLGMGDILIVAPYNAQVAALQERMPEARVGTVDRFQGQEAPVVIYSMTTSHPEDAPRGMGFLYSLSRLNVATSRARCMVILVANPGLLEVECHSPEQMRLASAFCEYVERAATAAATDVGAFRG